MFIKKYVCGFGVFCLLPISIFADEHVAHTNEVEISYVSLSADPDINGLEYDVNGYAVDVTHYLQPVSIDGSVPYYEASFVQHTPHIGIGYSSYDLTYRRNEVSLLKRNQDSPNFNILYVFDGTPFTLYLEIQKINIDNTLGDVPLTLYSTNSKVDATLLGAGYFLQKTTFLSLFVAQGDRDSSFSDSTTLHSDISYYSGYFRHLALLENQQALAVLLDYAKETHKDDGDGKTKYTSYSADVTFYVDPKIGLAFGYSANNSDEASNESHTMHLGYRQFLNKNLSLSLEYAKDSADHPQGNDTTRYGVKFTGMF